MIWKRIFSFVSVYQIQKNNCVKALLYYFFQLNETVTAFLGGAKSKSFQSILLFDWSTKTYTLSQSTLLAPRSGSSCSIFKGNNGEKLVRNCVFLLLLSLKLIRFSCSLLDCGSSPWNRFRSPHPLQFYKKTFSKSVIALLGITKV